MAYAILGWGSLVWDLDDLAPKVRGGWAMGAGPVLPVEFSRVSAKRLGALTLALDPEAGAPCPTHAIASAAASAEAAARDLAARERAPRARIGAVCLARGTRQGTQAGTVAAWCAAAGWTGAVWTDLPVNFADATGTAFSLAAAEAYLDALAGESRAEALRYIARAPAETDTPLRRRLSGDPRWAEALARHR